MNNVFIITGQTATGKTSYALKLASKYNGEIINCDSRQVYKKLNIITGKDLPIIKSKVESRKSKVSIRQAQDPERIEGQFKSQKEKNNFDIGYYIIHTQYSILNTKIWLYDIVDPKQYFSSFDYVQCAIPVIKDIFNRGKTPIIVGGTYLYLYHLLYEVETQSIPPDWKLRKNLNKKTVLELQAILQQFSNLAIEQLNNSERNNPQRLIRKIEIASFTLSNPFYPSKPCSAFVATSAKEARSGTLPSNPPNPSLSFSKFTLNKKLKFDINIKYQGFRYKDKEKLRKAIKERVENRLKNGAIEEVKSLLKNGYNINNPGLKTIGYQQIIKYLNKELTLVEAKKNWINKEIQYAKRQLTFMKRDKNINWDIV